MWISANWLKISELKLTYFPLVYLAWLNSLSFFLRPVKSLLFRDACVAGCTADRYEQPLWICLNYCSSQSFGPGIDNEQFLKTESFSYLLFSLFFFFFFSFLFFFLFLLLPPLLLLFKFFLRLHKNQNYWKAEDPQKLKCVYLQGEDRLNEKQREKRNGFSLSAPLTRSHGIISTSLSLTSLPSSLPGASLACLYLLREVGGTISNGSCWITAPDEVLM